MTRRSVRRGAPARRAAAAVGTAALGSALALGGCGQGAAPSSPGSSPAGLTVFAAASLTGPFTELADRFEKSHPGVEVRLNFAGSADLAAQILAGAPADIFASADDANMDKVSGAGLAAGDPAGFASNTLTIAVPPGNPAGITGFADLSRPGVQVVMCAVQVPCGAAADRIEQAAGISLEPVSEESSVTGVLGKVTTGEADAGIVYVTDIRSAGQKVEEVPLAEAAAAVNSYPLVRLAGSDAVAQADAFVEYVRGETGQMVLREAGFGAP